MAKDKDRGKRLRKGKRYTLPLSTPTEQLTLREKEQRLGLKPRVSIDMQKKEGEK